MTDDAVALMHLAHQLHRSLDRRLQGDFVHPKPPEAQIVALWQVRASPGMTVRELAAELQMQPNNASALVTAMVKNGLLTREPDQQDRRVVRLHVTEEARGRIDEVQDLFSGYLDAALGDLDEDEQSAVRAAIPALTRIARHVRAGRPPQDR
ncbi:MarR family winged helix-turn-helix transcriptional regulator [Actinoplanes sp. L3-i22]|uniref:MarR family winged helix-turn-helix transcriptional regulator n=1 Tax=Actinoplanes sp. L3-i22 TaxID=2836373 RepID=UPI001C851B9E|nr:MarR family transcriptional regulator [Actinoplanes sp. L3-i22]